MAGYQILAENIALALHAYAAREIEDPLDVEECVQGTAFWTLAIGVTLRDVAETLRGTGVHPDVPAEIEDAAEMARGLAGRLEHLEDFSLCGPRARPPGRWRRKRWY